MTAPRDPDRMIRAFIGEGADRLADPVYDAVRAEIDTKRQRVVIGPWRMPPVNKIVPLGLGAAALVAVLVVGTQVIRPPDADTVAGAATPQPSVPSSTATPSPAPSATPAMSAPAGPDGEPGGTVSYRLDGAPATTGVELSDAGTGVSGTAVTAFAAGTHTVSLECAARDGDTWALAGTVEQSTAEAGSVGGWSAVIVKDGSPQQIGIWVSDPKSDGIDCAGWLAAVDLADLPAGFLQAVESGALVAPSGAAQVAGDASGGTVRFQSDGAPATTELDFSTEGAGVSGTATTTFARGTHTVRLECAARDGDFWAVAGTVEQSSADAGAANAWSAVIVKEGSPQQIGVWLSDPKVDGVDCAGWLATIEFDTIGAENFQPAESGALFPPPGG
ncbi:MAG TPA: hypothetical protein VFY23_05995 [Candidatus Limnocylindrales bacterium]|nr:hypothetical protein [Candidatus Limnocylindrales bacterium]